MFVKEALNNIKKHAHAKQVEISFKLQGHNWALEIEDDGIGFDSQNTPPLHLKSRAQKMNAELEIINQEQNGTKLTLFLKNHHFN